MFGEADSSPATPVYAPAPAAETDTQEYVRVSKPSIHQMALTLERAGFIRRQPSTPAAANSSLIPNSCLSYLIAGSMGQNHCAEVLEPFSV